MLAPSGCVTPSVRPIPSYVYVPFHLSAVRENESGFRMHYRPATLRTALWQRLAGEVVGLLHCARCSAPACGRWFLKGEASRSDRLFCSKTCKVRAFRKKNPPTV